jgi:subtilisin family serine protease
MNTKIKSHTFLLSGPLLVASLVAAQNADAGVFRKALRPIKGHYIVVLKGEVAEADIDRQTDRIAFSRNARVGNVWKKAIHGFTAQMSAQEAEALANDPAVALVEEDGIMNINATQSNPTWGLDRIDQPSLPLSTTYTYDNNGAGVTAFIIDTGILSTHTDFGGRVVAGYTAISDGLGTSDCNGHGTHVAGTVGGSVYGVAKGVSLVPVRVLGCDGSGTTSGVIAGVNWVTSQPYRPAVANMSLGGGASSALDAAILNSINSGITYAIAAGNSNTNACNDSPARVASALTVGATTSSDARASYSNYGSCLDLFAPGSSIKSDYFSSNTATSTLSGTSMAAPHVAGVAALFLGANIGATPDQVSTALLQNSTPNRVISPGTSSPNRLLYTGLTGAVTPDTTKPSVTLANPTSGLTLTGSIQFAATASDEPAGSGISKVEFFVDNNSAGIDTSTPYSISWNSSSVTNGSHDFSAVATDVAGNVSTPSIVSANTSNQVSSPTCSVSSQGLLNGGFESGKASWTATSGIINNSSSAPARTGSWKAWINGYGRSNTGTLYQQISIPADACSATFNFWLYIFSSELRSAGTNDQLVITVSNTSGSVLGTLATYSNQNVTSSYVKRSFDLSIYKGQTIRLGFVGTENRSRATSFLIDDAELNIVR